jgi:eukaryotic-like serine/threonine-protein kinase
MSNALVPGVRLGPYEIVAPLGSGGMGEVFRARDTRLGREVAVKVFPDGVAHDADRLRRFEQEARAVAALSHPNILAVFDVGAHEAIPYFVTELLEGENLRERLDRGPLPSRRALELGLQIVQGLAAAHREGIVHRDLKPENVFVTRDGRIKILDFGLAKPTAPSDPAGDATLSTPFTSPGTVMGTVGYMSPEQARGESADTRSDIFSFGAIFYEMLAGRRAFRRDTAPETMAAILREEPPDLETGGLHLAGGVDRVVRRCLEKSPDLRFQSASDLAFAIQALGDASGSAGVLRPLPKGRSSRRWRVVPYAALPLALAVGYVAHRSKLEPQPSYAPLTFTRGYVRMARFAPDGQTVVFGALWEGHPMQVHSGRTDTRVSQPLGPPGADLLAVSAKAELAVALDRRFVAPWAPEGTLASMPMMGGAPRPLAEDVIDADFSPDGNDLAVSRAVDGRCRLEYPVGTVLYENAGYISDVRVSPRGDLIAFMDHPLYGDDRGTVRVVDRARKVRTLTPEWPTEQGLAWSPDAHEVWFTAAENNDEMSVRSVDLSGRMRLLLRSFHRVKLQDVARDGRVLLTTEDIQSDIRAGVGGGGEGPNLASFKWATARDLSLDGRFALINEFNAGNLSAYQVYLRGTDGAAPVSLGLGDAIAISPDARFVLASAPGVEGDLHLIPVGPGEPRTLAGGDLVFSTGSWFPSGSKVMLVANEAGHAVRTYVADTAASTPPAPLTEEGVAGVLVAPNGEAVLATQGDGTYVVIPISGGPSRRAAGLTPDDDAVGWLEDGRNVLAYQRGRPSAKVERVDIVTGTRTPWLDLEPRDHDGVLSVARVFFNRDGRRYLYEVRHVFSDLFVASGIR